MRVAALGGEPTGCRKNKQETTPSQKKLKMVFSRSGHLLREKRYYLKGISEREHAMLSRDLVTKRTLRKRGFRRINSI